MYRTDFWTLWEKVRVGDVSREQNRNMHIFYSETDRQSRMDPRDKCSGMAHWDDPEGWDGEGCERGVQDGEHV